MFSKDYDDNYQDVTDGPWYIITDLLLYSLQQCSASLTEDEIHNNLLTMIEKYDLSLEFLATLADDLSNTHSASALTIFYDMLLDIQAQMTGTSYGTDAWDEELISEAADTVVVALATSGTRRLATDSEEARAQLSLATIEQNVTDPEEILGIRERLDHALDHFWERQPLSWWQRMLRWTR